MITEKDELIEAKRQINSTINKLKETVKTLEAKPNQERYKSQITLAKRRIYAFEIAVSLIEKEMESDISEMKRNIFLSTARIGFSLWTNKDLPLAEQLWGNHDVTKYICASGSFSKKDISDRLAVEIRNQEEYQMQYWPIFSLDTAGFIGCCGLRPYNTNERIYEIGFHLLPVYWGQGIGSEAAEAVIDYAFTVLKANNLFAGHHPANKSSAGMLKKLGFHYTHDEYYEATGLDHPSYQYKLS